MSRLASGLPQYARERIAAGADPASVVQWFEDGDPMPHACTLEHAAALADLANYLHAKVDETISRRLKAGSLPGQDRLLAP